MAVLGYSRTRTVEPAMEPLTISEAKAHLRVTGSDDDTYIESLIVTAREELERQARIALINQTWVAKLDEWPLCRYIELRPAPLSSVTSITYLDETGTSQTLASSEYEVDTGRMPGVVHLAYNATWPTTRITQNAITITYVAGYGEDADNVPRRAKHAMLLWIESHFCGRGMEGGSRFAWDTLIRGLQYGDYP